MSVPVHAVMAFVAKRYEVIGRIGPTACVGPNVMELQMAGGFLCP